VEGRHGLGLPCGSGVEITLVGELHPAVPVELPLPEKILPECLWASRGIGQVLFGS
jgi:hypothetical protein